MLLSFEMKVFVLKHMFFANNIELDKICPDDVYVKWKPFRRFIIVNYWAYLELCGKFQPSWGLSFHRNTETLYWCSEFIKCWKKSIWQPVIEDRNSYTDMLVTSLCTPIILNACRYFHKRLNIQSHILYNSYHMSPLIQAALSVRALNRSMGLNLFKCASFCSF